MTLDLSKLRAVAERAAKVSPGPWAADSTENEGEYGSGPDTRIGFSSATLSVQVGDKWKTIADSINADHAEVHEEWDSEGGSAWDEIARVNFAHMEAFGPPTALELIARVEAAEAEASHQHNLFIEEAGKGDLLEKRAELAKARVAKLREALVAIAKEQSATTATMAADRFQEIARVALEDTSHD